MELTTAGTVSTRLVWPFARTMKDYGVELSVIRAAGLSEAILADSNARLPRTVVDRLLQVSLRKTGDAALGLHAGERVEAGDLGVIEYAARTCSDLRSALNCYAQYARLLDDEMEMRLIEHGDLAMWRIRFACGDRLPAVNDFIVACTLAVARRLVGFETLSVEVWFKHSSATDPAEYQRFFRGTVRLGAEDNTIVFPRAALDFQLTSANRDLFAAFDAQASQMLERLARAESVSAQARRFLVEELSGGNVGMNALARRLRMSSSTVKRRLADEGTSHREILADVRRELALEHLANNVSVTRVAGLLGFTTVAAFSRAFRRWQGVSPQDYRCRAWTRQEGVSRSL